MPSIALRSPKYSQLALVTCDLWHKRKRKQKNAWFETVAEAQRRAKKRLPSSVYGALVAGSEKGVTLDDNTAAFSESA